MQDIRPPKRQSHSRLIQDIAPPGGRRDRTLRAAGQTARRVHQATQLSTLAQNVAVRRAQSFDMVQPRGPQRPYAKLPDTKKTAKRAVADTKHGFWHRAGEFAQYPLIAGLAIAFAYSSTAGQIAVGLYGMLALVLRLDSKYTFGAALLLLASIPGFQVLNLTGVAQNTAIYAYELLVVGVIQAVVSLLFEKRQAARQA